MLQVVCAQCLWHHKVANVFLGLPIGESQAQFVINSSTQVQLLLILPFVGPATVTHTVQSVVTLALLSKVKDVMHLQLFELYKLPGSLLRIIHWFQLLRCGYQSGSSSQYLARRERGEKKVTGSNPSLLDIKHTMLPCRHNNPYNRQLANLTIPPGLNH